MKKILAISHSCVTDVNQQLYVSLQQLPGVEIEMVVPATWRSDYTGDLFSPTLLPAVDFPVHRVPVAMPGNISLHFYRKGLSRVIRDSRPDVIFVDEEPWSLVAAQSAQICRRLKVPFLCYTKQNINKRYPPPFAWIEQRTYRSAAAIIALSEEVSAVLRSKGYKGSCPLLAHACDLSLFHQGSSLELRKKLGLRGTVIGYLGRFVKEKGLDILIHAVAQIRRQPGTEFSVLMVGSGPEESNLRQMIAEAGLESCFLFTGVVPHNEAGEYMRCMDLFVLPSLTTPRWKEQFGRVIIEAMACGVPVVGSDSGQIPYLIKDTGGGIVFKEGDPADLAGRLLCLLDDPVKRSHLGKTGNESVRNCYTYEAIAQQLYRIFQEALYRNTPISGRGSLQ